MVGFLRKCFVPYGCGCPSGCRWIPVIVYWLKKAFLWYVQTVPLKKYLEVPGTFGLNILLEICFLLCTVNFLVPYCSGFIAAVIPKEKSRWLEMRASENDLKISHLTWRVVFRTLHTYLAGQNADGCWNRIYTQCCESANISFWFGSVVLSYGFNRYRKI